MRKRKNTGVATRKPIVRLKKPYEGGDDISQWIWSNRTHRSASEAFRDADYATPIWRCETEWDKTKEYLKWIGMWVGFLFLMYQFMVGFEKWIAS